jgi:hypothetical protein
MVRRKFLNAAVLAAAIFPLSSCSDTNNPGGAGGTGGSGGTGGTGGTAGAPSKDAGPVDASTDAPSGDAAPDKIADTGATLPDGSVPPSGTQLVPGSVTVRGVTSDNYAVYSDDTTGTLNVIPLAGGSATIIGSADDRIAIRGTAVVSWVGSARVSPLSVWTAAHGTKALSASSYANAAAISTSPDGAHVLYFDGVDTARTRGDLFIAGTNGTGQKLLVAGVALNNTACAPVLAFGGNAAAGAAFCVATVLPDGGTADAGPTEAGPIDAGSIDADGATLDADIDGAILDVGTLDAPAPDAGSAPSAVVQAYSGTGWTVVNIATNVDPRIAMAPTGTTVLVSAPAGLLAYPVAGGAPTTIDAAGGFGSFTNDGLSVIYTTPANALKRSTVVSPSPVTLATSGIAGLRAKSPDEKWVLGYTSLATGDLSDLYLASATVAGTPTTLSTAVTAGLFGSDGFTADSSRAIYYTDIDPNAGIGNFFAVNPTGGTPVALGTNVWLHYAGTGAKVAFNDNYDGSLDTADIRVADTSQSAPPKLVVSLAHADFFVAGSKDKVVYAWKYLTGSMAGLWVTPMP